ncbi:hypothetical protein M9H77_29640 [Catharanthus roseus]|uniref:Uncharacterized protein n=1 Tax=Catharanthus roseus TaxID=4058 RepID=A0ACB9ZV06_CATRO|nr:hypothetical protein M9H77_29640 [Catharanthus roseus]
MPQALLPKLLNPRALVNTLPKIGGNFPTWANGLPTIYQDLLDKSIRRIVETYSYMISSFEAFVIALKGIGPFKNYFFNVKVQLGNPCDDRTDSKKNPFKGGTDGMTRDKDEIMESF